MNPTILTDFRRQLSTTVLDQGLRSTCLAISISEVHQAARSGEGLAPDALWMTVYGTGHSPYEGLGIEEAAAAVENPGQPLMSTMPLIASFDPDLQWPVGVFEEPWHQARLGAFGGTEGLHEAVEAEEIAILIVEVTTSFLHLRTNDAVIDADAVRQQDYVAHAVACVGTGLSATGDDLYLIRNSWGSAWADGGDGWVTAAFLDQHCLAVMRVDEVYPIP
ncbi:hypothetical protein NYQ35_10580 [Curtobacterium flaccumfaciens pv. flaccumfaciens]|uniref:C1 family peptidase n=1 Tax=Curtobacterium flaccumfaciens TaxID=2035 RepID=UPI00217CC53B|nr:C1 family peptidase [Curtobacterium flaccumfaciens]MCS6569250.1 hypothetical protein [Curtobacterium flaccumfaciens pv. flaccumfaciens]MCS6584354.1 hypothetical protein [Curtobacterium flaccumfaciens pv. flaccumfaciens]